MEAKKIAEKILELIETGELDENSEMWFEYPGVNLGSDIDAAEGMSIDLDKDVILTYKSEKDENSIL